MTFFLQLPRPMREELCLNMSVSSYRELDTIIAEGEVGHRFFVLLEGNVAVFKSVAKATDNLRMHHTFYRNAAENIKLATEETLEAGDKSCSSNRRQLYEANSPSNFAHSSHD